MIGTAVGLFVLILTVGIDHAPTEGDNGTDSVYVEPVKIDVHSDEYAMAVILESSYIREVRKGDRTSLMAASVIAQSAASYYQDAGDVEGYERMQAYHEDLEMFLSRY